MGVPPLRHLKGSGTVHVHKGSTTARTPTNEVVLVYTADGSLLLFKKFVQDVSHEAFSIKHSSMLIINNVTPSSVSICTKRKLSKQMWNLKIQFLHGIKTALSTVISRATTKHKRHVTLAMVAICNIMVVFRYTNYLSWRLLKNENYDVIYLHC
jgi:hypothetical protein